MMRRVLAVLGSLGLHGVAGAVLAVMLVPQPVPEQGGSPSQIELAVMRVERSVAAEREPDSPDLPGADTGGTRAAGNVVPQRRAMPVSPKRAAQPAQSFGQRVAPVVRAAPVQTAVSASGAPLAPQRAGSLTVGSSMPDAPRAAPRRPGAVRVNVAEAQSRVAFASTPPAPEARPAQVAPAVSQVLEAGGLVISRTRPPASTALQVAPVGARVGAGFAWSGAEDITLDAQSLAALQALLQPGAPSARELRDAVAAVLAAPECSRIQTVFDEQTGALELRGHIPETGAAAPLLAALRAEMGTGLPLQENLRILPRPQCGVLDGIDRLGLPQSEEQLTDKQLIGANAHVREYAFGAGDRLVIDLVAPDYAAFVYVDYFDAEGQVIHLTPNEYLPLERHEAETAFAIGRDGPLDLRIAPPFGQDIAVAFAASAPLYDGLRPIIEPAEPYLQWLRARVEEARAKDTAFRGEWVYLFVATGPEGFGK